MRGELHRIGLVAFLALMPAGCASLAHEAAVFTADDASFASSSSEFPAEAAAEEVEVHAAAMAARDEPPSAAVALDGLVSEAPPSDDEPAEMEAAPTASPSADSGSEFFSEVDRILASLPMGSASFGVPPALRVGERTTARLRLSLRESAAQLEQEIRSLSPDAAAVLSDSVRVSKVMLAKLDATSGLKIRLLGDQPERLLDPSGTEEWIWEVEGAASGSERLHLELFAVISIDGSERRSLRKTWDAEIVVEVPPAKPLKGQLMSWAGKNFQWLWAAFVVPLVGFGYRFLQSRRSKSASAAGAGKPDISDHVD